MDSNPRDNPLSAILQYTCLKKDSLWMGRVPSFLSRPVIRKKIFMQQPSSTLQPFNSKSHPFQTSPFRSFPPLSLQSAQNIEIASFVEINQSNNITMTIVSKYAGKRVLMTGTTGFVGKVMLQKFLFSLSAVDKIYVLIRNKEGSNLSERFKKEIVSSPCFNRLRGIYKGKFDEFIHSKVQPIQGDLHKPGLGLVKEVEEELIQTCHIVINCAASIDFNARLDESIESNIKGSLRMMELARKLKHLEIFTHVSTCYVNSDQRGLVKEEIYDKDTDPQEEMKYLESLTLNELVQNTKTILGKFPNTYTFTKSLCERLMKKRKLDLPICIVRPSIINTSYLQPFPGWIDSIAAAAALFMLIGLGIVQQLKGNPKKIGDMIPVDVVVSTIIVASAFNMKNPNLTIYHVGSSDRNPLIWGEIRDEVVKYWNTNVVQNRLSKARCSLSENEWTIKMSKIKRTIPIQAYNRLGPLMGKNHKKNAEKMRKTMARGEEIGKIFEFFVQNEWIFECRNFKKLWDFLSPQERKQFLIDVAEIDFLKYVELNNYGIQQYIIKENVEIPLHNYNLLKVHEDSYFSDIKWVWNTEIPIKGKRIIAEMKTKILSSSRVLKAIETEALKRNQLNPSLKKDSATAEVRMQAEKIIDGLVGETKIPAMRTMAYTLHKLFNTLYERVNINMEMLEQIREIEKNSSIPIVLLPTHRSYFDFLIVSYIFFVYKLRLPYFVQDEAFLQSTILAFVAKSCGAFFFQKNKYETSRLYKIIFDKYFELLLREGSTLEFFIENTRSRTGKILTPRFQMLNIVLDTILYGKVPEVCIIPMTINYEKVFQGDTFPNELLGEEKVAESLLRVIKATPKMASNYGRVYVEICKPIMGRQFIENLQKTENINMEKPESRRILLKSFGKEIITRMINSIVIMSTAIVSSVLLMHRKGISEDQLIKTVTEISKYILRKGYRVGGVNQNSSAAAVRNTIGYLSGITTKTKKNIFELTISAGDEFQKILMLSYYRNTLTHAFLPQAFVGCALSAFGDQLNMKEGVPLSRIHEQSNFLMRLLREQYFLQYSLDAQSDFTSLMVQMQDYEILQMIPGDKVVISKTGTRMIAFYSSLIRPQIQSYWASLVYIITIARTQESRQETSSLNKFFDTVQWFMQSLYEEKVIEDYEACSRELIKSAFEKFQKQKLIRMNAGGKKKEAQIEILASLEQLQGLQNSIKFFRRNVVSSVLSPMQVAKSSMKEMATLSKL